MQKFQLASSPTPLFSNTDRRKDPVSYKITYHKDPSYDNEQTRSSETSEDTMLSSCRHVSNTAEVPTGSVGMRGPLIARVLDLSPCGKFSNIDSHKSPTWPSRHAVSNKRSRSHKITRVRQLAGLRETQSTEKH